MTFRTRYETYRLGIANQKIKPEMVFVVFQVNVEVLIQKNERNKNKTNKATAASNFHDEMI